MTSKRNLKREVEQLSEEEEKVREPIVMNLTSEPATDVERALATKPHPDHSDRETVAIPKVIPRRFWPKGDSITLTVVSSANWGNYLFEEPDGEDTFFAVDLWDRLTDDELATELAHRRENDKQVPPYLREKVDEA